MEFGVFQINKIKTKDLIDYQQRVALMSQRN